MNEVLNVAVYFATFFYVGQTYNAKYFCPGELRPNAAKYKPLKQYGEAKALFERRDSVSSKCSKHNTIRGGGRMRKKHKCQRVNKGKQNLKRRPSRAAIEKGGCHSAAARYSVPSLFAAVC